MTIDAFAYLVNATAASCITSTNSAILSVRYPKHKNAATCAPTPAPSVNPAQPFVLFREGQRCSEAGRLAPFEDRRLSLSSGMNRHGGDGPAQRHSGDRDLQSIDSPEACYAYCSLNAGEETPFFFNWNTVTSQCFCCGSVCTPFIFDPDYNLYEVLLPTTPVPTAVPTSAEVPTPAPTSSDLCQPYIPDPEEGFTFYLCGPLKACSGVLVAMEGIPDFTNCALTCKRSSIPGEFSFPLSTYNSLTETCQCSLSEAPNVMTPSGDDILVALEPEFNPPTVLEECPEFRP
ncbi:hypothetical protein Naga_100777g1, partial [Nannochloropsis gaditana]